MLRLPPFAYHRPRSLDGAIRLLQEDAGRAMPISGGTDLLPNLKHRLFSPKRLVSLTGIGELRGIRIEESGEGSVLFIGAGERLADVASSPLVRARARALAQAAGLVAGPQLRNMGTIGGNVCLDTRCTYYNQTEFWRKSLGYCLKKDGELCHVTRVGKRCVAAHSADTPAALIALGASLRLAGPAGERTIPAASFFILDGVWNTRRRPDEVLVRIEIPLHERGLRSAYRKLRLRRSIDFPLLSIAGAASFGADGSVRRIRGVVSALGARPKVLSGWGKIAAGRALDEHVASALAKRAGAQCRPLANIAVDEGWRRAMVPVYTRQMLRDLARTRSPEDGLS